MNDRFEPIKHRTLEQIKEDSLAFLKIQEIIAERNKKLPSEEPKTQGDGAQGLIDDLTYTATREVNEYGN
jgi:hypothetical protein